ncbi:MAG: hypothetical protein GX595_17155 [Lentisphaerae bacterium]|nr:hypothetical protein [Lentisphaerota bacterium]
MGAAILIVAAVLAARAVMKSNTTTASGQSAAAATAFGPPPVAGAAVAAESAVTQPPEPAVNVTANEPAAPVLGTTAVSASAAPVSTASAAPAAATAAAPAAQAAAETSVGTEIGAISDLNRLAADQTGVFVFVPSRKADAAPPPKAPMEAAARTISAQGNKIGLFTLKVGTSDYEQIAMQVVAPGVLALAKGGGMKAVSGEITETKLVQAFVAASSAGGGCGPASGGCGPSGCK